MPKKGEYNSTGFNADKVKKNISQGSEIYYNPYNRRRGRNDSDMRTPRIGLAHELQHSFDVDKKVATYERTKKRYFINGYTRYQYREPNKKK